MFLLFESGDEWAILCNDQVHAIELNEMHMR